MHPHFSNAVPSLQFVSETHDTHFELSLSQFACVQLSPPPHALHFSRNAPQFFVATSEHLPTFVVLLTSVHDEPDGQFWFDVQPLVQLLLPSFTQYVPAWHVEDPHDVDPPCEVPVPDDPPLAPSLEQATTPTIATTIPTITMLRMSCSPFRRRAWRTGLALRKIEASKRIA